MLVVFLRVALPAVVLYALQAPTLRAGIIPVSQDRSILLRVNGLPIDFDETRAASGFERFDESLSVPGHGTAQQTSSIFPLLVRAVGFTEAASSRNPFTFVDANSDFDLRFDVASTETWHLKVSMTEAPGGCCGAALFSLVGPGVSIVFEPNNGPSPDPFTIDQLVELTPGSYRLQFFEHVAAQEESFSLSYDVTLQSTIPEPGSVWLLVIGSVVISARARYRVSCRKSTRNRWKRSSTNSRG